MLPNKRLCWLTFAAVLLCILAIWLPFGFSMGGIIEEWDIFFYLDKFGLTWNAFLGHSVFSNMFLARPLFILPFYLARLIDAHSFIGLHIVLIISCIIKIIAGVSIGRFLLRNNLYAIAFGILVLVFPADTQQIATRISHINLSVALMFSGIATSLWAVLTKDPKKRWTYLLLSVFCSCTSVLIYEATFPLYASMPLLIFARYGLKKYLLLVRKKLYLWLLWLLAPIANGLYLFWSIKIQKSAYQFGLAGGNNTNGSIIKAIYHNLFYIPYSGIYRAFYDAWISAWIILTEKVAHYPYIIVMAIFLMGLLFLAAQGAKYKKISLQILFRLLFIGMIIFILGYLSTICCGASHSSITQRTFLTSALGAAIVLVSIIVLIFYRFPVKFAIIGLYPAMLLGLVVQLYQHDQWARFYNDVIGPYISKITYLANTKKSVHLVYDRSGFGPYLYGISQSKITFGVDIFTKKPDDTYILCKAYPTNDNSQCSDYRLHGDKIEVVRYGQPAQQYLKNSVDIIVADKDFIDNFHQTNSWWGMHGWFKTTNSIFIQTDNLDHYTCEADSMWGYSKFCRGEGWSKGYFYHNTFFRHQIAFFAIAPNTSLIFSLQPQNYNHYILQVHFYPYNEISTATINNLHLSINGYPLQTTRPSETTLKAVVSTTLLHKGQNEIEFANTLPQGQTLGISVSRVDLSPENSAYLTEAKE